LPEKGTPLADCPYVVSVLSIPAIAISRDEAPASSRLGGGFASRHPSRRRPIELGQDRLKQSVRGCIAIEDCLKTLGIEGESPTCYLLPVAIPSWEGWVLPGRWPNTPMTHPALRASLLGGVRGGFSPEGAGQDITRSGSY